MEFFIGCSIAFAVMLMLALWLRRYDFSVPSASQVIMQRAKAEIEIEKELKKKRWCKNCEYCQDTSKPKVICKRYPFMQKVDRHYWCGEFKKNEKK